MARRCAFVFGTVLLINSFLIANLTVAASECTADSCGPTTLFEADASESDLYLLQRKAQVIIKSTSSAGSRAITDLASRLPKVTPTRLLTVDTASDSISRHHLLNRQLHSRSSAFVTALRSRAPNVTYDQRLAMLSTTQASGLSEPWTCVIIIVCSLVFFVAVAAVVLETFFANIFAEIIELGIVAVADEILGLDVKFGSMQVGVVRGSVLVTDLQVANPGNWKSTSFLNVNKVEVHLNLLRYAWKYIFSNAQIVELNYINLLDVNLVLEKSMWSSNVHDILAILHGTKPKPESKSSRPKSEPTKSGKESEFILHKFTIADIYATVTLLGRIAVPSIQCDDFDLKTEGKVRTSRAIAIEILKAFCEKVVSFQPDGKDPSPITSGPCHEPEPPPLLPPLSKIDPLPKRGAKGRTGKGKGYEA